MKQKTCKCCGCYFIPLYNNQEVYCSEECKRRIFRYKYRTEYYQTSKNNRRQEMMEHLLFTTDKQEDAELIGEHKAGIGRTNTLKIYRVTKRHYTNGICEVCEKLKLVGFGYHHWDKIEKPDKITKGMWLCRKCHLIVEHNENPINQEIYKRYLEIKQKINEETK